MRSEKIIRTPLGWVGVAVSDCGVTRLVLPRKSRSAAEKELRSAELPLTPALSLKGRGEQKILKQAVELIKRYFSGEHVSCDLPIDVRSHTPFQQAVWKTCASIPFGETRPYGWIAKRIRKPNASRAVGQAMGANPVPILIP